MSFELEGALFEKVVAIYQLAIYQPKFEVFAEIRQVKTTSKVESCLVLLANNLLLVAYAHSYSIVIVLTL